MEPAQVVVMQLLSVVNQPEPDLNRIEQLLVRISPCPSNCCVTSTTSRATPTPFPPSPGRRLSRPHPAQTLRDPGRRHQRRPRQSAELYQMSMIRPLLRTAGPHPCANPGSPAGLHHRPLLPARCVDGTADGQAARYHSADRGEIGSPCWNARATWGSICRLRGLRVRTGSGSRPERPGSGSMKKVSQLYLTATAWVNQQLQAMAETDNPARWRPPSPPAPDTDWPPACETAFAQGMDQGHQDPGTARPSG